MPPRKRTRRFESVVELTVPRLTSSTLTGSHSTRPAPAGHPEGDGDDTSSDESSAVRGQLLVRPSAVQRNTRAETDIVSETDNEGTAVAPSAPASTAVSDDGAEAGGAALMRSVRAGKTYSQRKGKGTRKGREKAVAPANVEGERDDDAVGDTDYEEELPPRYEGAEEATPPASDDGEDEELSSSDDKPDEQRPPKVFMHWGNDDWVADRIWVHDRWVRPGKREQAIKYIKNNGGKVMREMRDANIAIVPDWTDESYQKLYIEAQASGSNPTVYAWLQDCSRQTASHGVPFRPPHRDYAAPVPKSSSSFEHDRRGKRYLRLPEEELERFAQWYNRWKAGQVGLEEVFERMQREFYNVNQSHRTTISAYRAAFDEHKLQIRTLARRLRDARTSRSPSPSDASPGARKRRASCSASPASRRKSQSKPRARIPGPDLDPTRDRDRDPEPALVGAFASLAALAARSRRPPSLVRALCLACSLDVARTERALDRLAEYEMAGAGLSGEDEDETAVDPSARTRWVEFCDEVWREEEDEVLRAAGDDVGDAELAERLGGAKSARDVAERRELLGAIGGGDGAGWTVTKEELRRMRHKGVPEEDDEDGAGGDEANCGSS
ncbi:hypothetical protein JCM3770_006020 [Rhodotorula araucariae]